MKLDTNKTHIAMANKVMNCPDLAKATGLSFNTINEYLAGKRNVTPKSLGKISKALDVSVEDLIED